MKTIQTVRASLTLLPDLQRGRNTLIRGYRPHIVIGPIDQRVAKMEGRTIVEKYEGVVFLDENLIIEPGQTVEVTLALMYYQEPNVLYEDVQPGVTFTLREGASIVGFGTILSRAEQALGGDAWKPTRASS
jgi:hypothetical protein